MRRLLCKCSVLLHSGLTLKWLLLRFLYCFNIITIGRGRDTYFSFRLDNIWSLERKRDLSKYLFFVRGIIMDLFCEYLIGIAYQLIVTFVSFILGRQRKGMKKQRPKIFHAIIFSSQMYCSKHIVKDFKLTYHLEKITLWRTSKFFVAFYSNIILICWFMVPFLFVMVICCWNWNNVLPFLQMHSELHCISIEPTMEAICNESDSCEVLYSNAFSLRVLIHLRLFHGYHF